MKKFETTLPSSSEVDAALVELEPSVRDYLYDLYDQLQRFRQGPAKARQARSEALEASVERCYLDHRAAIEAYPLRDRTGVLYSKLKHRHGHYGLDHTPCLRLVRRIVHRLAKQKDVLPE